MAQSRESRAGTLVPMPQLHTTMGFCLAHLTRNPFPILGSSRTQTQKSNGRQNGRPQEPVDKDQEEGAGRPQGRCEQTERQAA